MATTTPTTANLVGKLAEGDACEREAQPLCDELRELRVRAPREQLDAIVHGLRTGERTGDGSKE